MYNDSQVEAHFDAIKSIIAPYHGHRIVDALPGALLFVIQFSQMVTTDSPVRERLMRDLDSVTSMIGKIGDIVKPTEFEQIKKHYAELQVRLSRSEGNKDEMEDNQ